MISKKLGLSILIALVLTGCAVKSANKLPENISGISIGMNREDANARLTEIAVFERDERKRQQVWRLKNDPHFNYIAVGYDADDKIRYVTAFVDKQTANELIHFSEVGDLSTAKTEIIEPHYRYIWEVPASDAKSAYQVNIYGDNSEFVTIYSLSKMITPGETKQEEEEEDE